MQPHGSSGALRRSFASAVATGLALVRSRYAEIAAAAAALLLYLPVLDFGFVFDDGSLIAADGSPVRLGGVVPYRPLRYASYAIDSWLGGTPAIYHLHNVLLHALVAAMVVALARRLGAARWAALAGGLLVAWHPLAVEAAAYVAGRRDLLCVALGVGAIHAHLSGRTKGALALLVLSAAAKESGLLFAAPLVAATLAGAGGERGRPLAVVAVAATAFAITLAYGAIGPWAPQAGLAGLALPGLVVSHYLGSLAGMHALSPEYPGLLDIAARAASGDAAVALHGLAVGALVALGLGASLGACVRARRSGAGSERAFALAWTAAVVAALGLWGGLHEPGADRHAYLLLPALAAADALWLSSLDWFPVRAAAVATVVVALAASAAGTRSYMPVWQDEDTLWSHAVRHPLASARAHSNMARVLAERGEYATAAHHLDAALAIEPGEPLLYVGRAALRCAQGREPLVRRDLRRARRVGADEALVRGVELDCGAAGLRTRTAGVRTGVAGRSATSAVAGGPAT